MTFDVIFFDLDATLYPASNGLWPAIGARIDLYMQEHLGFRREQISQLRQKYYLEHGTTLCGLQKFYQVDAQHYLAYVHDVPLVDFIQPDPLLRRMLLSIPKRRWIFTNSDQAHARRVLDQLGILDCFEGLVDIFAQEPNCKPHPDAYALAMRLAGIKEAERCALLDDSDRNLQTAKDMGFFTVMIGNHGNHPAADRCLIDIHDLPSVVPELWQTT